jgi:hypothetical protein
MKFSVNRNENRVLLSHSRTRQHKSSGETGRKKAVTDLRFTYLILPCFRPMQLTISCNRLPSLLRFVVYAFGSAGRPAD